MALKGRTLPYVPPAAATLQQISSLNKVIDILNSLQRTNLLTDGTNDRIILGSYNDAFQGLKISKPGVDVKTATDDQLIFNSNLNVMKILSTGTVTLDRPAGQSSVYTDVAAIGGANAFLAWGTLSKVSPALTFPLQYTAYNTSGVAMWGIRAFYDATAKVVRFFNEAYDTNVINSSNYTVDIKYYLFVESLK